jgi:glycosyltransferase involved in cell wall biosynthesis
MTFQPFISIVIPTLLEEKLLGKVLEQFTPSLREKFSIEIVVSDGGSTDGTIPIARLGSDILVENESGERQTISIGRNRGAAAARGRILMFINADTIIDSIDDFLTDITRVAAIEEISGVTCNVGVHRELERPIDRISHSMFNMYFRMLNIIGLGMGRGECQIVRRELFFDIGGYNEHIAAGEDFDLFVRLRKRGKIAFLKKHMVRESPRRYRQLGYLYTTILWSLNGLSVLLFRKSVATEWKPIR